MSRFVEVWRWLLLSLCLSGVVLSTGCYVALDEGACEYNGTTYQNGLSFPAADDCNTCSCVNGESYCTTIACADPVPAGSCERGGYIYPNGSVISAGDDCNTCACVDSEFICSATPCSDPNACVVDGVSYTSGTWAPAGDGCNSCLCEDGMLTSCTEAACVVECSTTSDCGSSEFCSFTLEAACGSSGRGVCAPRTDVCPTIYAPVCGCDGNTYSNSCVANGSGVSVASTGPCGVGMECGGALDIACPEGSFCDYPLEAMCGATDLTGSCARLPEACGAVYDPVCGCDNNTYSNSCMANAAGVSVQFTGECEEPAPRVCGGIAGLTCDAGDYCNYPIAAMCGAGDMTGICVPMTSACTEIWMPVCGCDGNTYGNSCEAASVGVSVASEGACSAAGRLCGTRGAMPCERGEFCLYSEAAMCGATDLGGVCTLIPETCTRIYAPVCGCDGVTYSNECLAHSVGVSAASSGACS